MVVIGASAGMYLLRNVGHGCCMIKVETCRAQLCAKLQELRRVGLLGNQERVHGAPVQLIHERERGHPIIRGMDASIANYRLPSVLQHTTRPTDFLTST